MEKPRAFAGAASAWKGIFTIQHALEAVGRSFTPKELEPLYFNGKPYYLAYRPLWDIVVILLLGGMTVLSCTTVVPMNRRLNGHAVRLGRKVWP